MSRRSERSFVFLFACFVFVCLLLSGGSRLIGTQGEEDAVPQRPVSPMRAAFASAPAPKAETGGVQRHEQAAHRSGAAPAPENLILNTCVMSDANGNVLRSRTYLRAVYQAFALGDGFV